MPVAPDLRVVPLDRIRRHEEIDPLRVDRLVERLSSDGIQVNPMICTSSANGDLVLLDGATRTEALKSMGLNHAVVQLVEPEKVTLEAWHHVIRDCSVSDVMRGILDTGVLELSSDGWAPCVRLSDETSHSVNPKQVSANAALSALVATYVGRWTVNRVTHPSIASVAWRFPDWTAIIEFPILSVQDVIASALSGDLLPAGITRFLVDERALRLNIDLDLLSTDTSIEKKQETLEGILEERANDGRIRRYEETIVMLDD